MVWFKRRSTLPSAIAGVIILAGLGGAARADLVPLTQSRQVSVATDANDGILDDNHANQQAAPNLAPFNGNVSVKSVSGDPGSGSIAIASAFQQSSIDVNDIQATGTVEANSSVGTGLSAFAQAQSQFQVTFNVMETELFQLAETANITADFADPESNTASLAITSAADAPIFGPVIVNAALDQTLPLTLAPGQYTMAFTATSSSGDEVDNSIGYSVSLSTASAAAVPLPRAAISGTALLACLGALGRYRRMHHTS